jgi:hypothetical protein
MQHQRVMESPHFWTGSAVLVLLAVGSLISLTKNFKGGTRHVIYPWNPSKISNRKSSRPRIYPWGQSKI